MITILYAFSIPVQSACPVRPTLLDLIILTTSGGQSLAKYEALHRVFLRSPIVSVAKLHASRPWEVSTPSPRDSKLPVQRC
jgi:hypothetical protein